MRRRHDGFRPVIEVLIASACLAFGAQGARLVSLSGAPFARAGRRRLARPRPRRCDASTVETVRILATAQLVSLLSDDGVPLEQIAHLVGHAGGSTVTETVYRKQLWPIIDDGATAMNRIPRPER